MLLSGFWLVLAAMVLALSWLLPNHLPPWTSFHADAWAALVLGIIAVAISVRARNQAAVRTIDIYLLGVAAIPLVQWVGGLVTSLGIAWIYGAYLIGLLIAVQVGRLWELDSPGQCADFVFLTVMLAAAFSTGLQLYQLFGPEDLGTWVMSVPSRHRMFANVAQPNQLASLQLLAVIGCSWFYTRGRLAAGAAVSIAAYLLMGVALTGSRTAWVNMALLLVACIALRQRMVSVRHTYIVAGLAVYFATLLALMPSFYQMLSLSMNVTQPDLVRAAQDIRIAIWSQFIDASVMQPWFGYGWGQTAIANFQVAGNSTTNLGLYHTTHNLILDLVIWNGYPIAMLLVTMAAAWLLRRLWRLGDGQELHLWAFVGILLVHSMLEFPLHYAVFLLPFGMVLGVLDAPQAKASMTLRSRLIIQALVLAGLAITGITIRDYLLIERSYTGLRFEVRGIKTDIPSTPPETWVLTQFHDYFRVVRAIPHAGMDLAEIQLMRNSLGTVPSPQSIYNLAASLALNGQGEEAKHWLSNLCLTMVDVSCEQAKRRWRDEDLEKRSGVAWPSQFASKP